VEHDEPADRPSTRDRGAAVVIQDGRMLAIACAPQKGGHFIPGGGVEPGETPEEAAIRELHEETGLRRADRVRLVGGSSLPSTHERQ
jgi:8-oxo-dGTP diphosphatase